MNRYSLAAILGTISLLTPSCSQADSAAGVYAVDMKPTIDGIIASQPGAAQLPPEARATMEEMFSLTFASMEFELKADNTFTGTKEIMGATSTATGTWSEANGKVTINTTHEDGVEKPDSQTGTYKEGILIIEGEEGGQKLQLHLKKKDN